MEITVYTQPNCPQCAATIRWLNQRKIRHTQLEAQKAVGMLKRLGHTSAPVIIITDKNSRIVDSWSGYRPDRLNQAAKEDEK